MTSRERIKNKWKTESEYFNEETGEVIDKREIKSGKYILIKTIKNYRKDGNTNIREYSYACRRSKQFRIFSND
jgi:hypothetical protein